MIRDDETNFLWLSDKIVNYPTFFRDLVEVLNRQAIPWLLLPNTKDIWCVDFMPIQITNEHYVQFVYTPSYLQAPKYLHLQTLPSDVTGNITGKIKTSSLLLDGGNVIKGKDWVILTDRIFKENKFHSRKNILNEIESLFNAKPIIIPTEPYDWTGHADGVLRYYNDNTVLVNDYSKIDKYFETKLEKTLAQEKINTIKIPHFKCDSKNTTSAKGYYINFLQMKDFIFLPQFNDKHDSIVFDLFQSLFPKSRIETINALEISQHGGVLNCITWNINT